MAKNRKKKTDFYANFSIWKRGIPPLFFLFGILLLIFFTLELFHANHTPIGIWIVELLLGLFSHTAYLSGPILILFGFLWKRDFLKKRALRRILYIMLASLLLEASIYSIFFWKSEFSLSLFFESGILGTGAGLFGSILGYGLFHISLFFGAPLLLVLLVFLFLFDFYRISPIRKIRKKKAKSNSASDEQTTPLPEDVSSSNTENNELESNTIKMSIFEKLRQKKEEKQKLKEEKEQAKREKELEDTGYFPPQMGDDDSFDAIRKKMSETSREMDKEMQKNGQTSASVSSILEEVNRQKELEAIDSLTVLDEDSDVLPVGNKPMSSSVNKADSVFSNFNPLENDVLNNRDQTVLLPQEAKEESPFKNKLGAIRFQGTIGSSALRTTPTQKAQTPSAPEPRVIPSDETIQAPEIPYVHPATQPSTQLYAESTPASPTYTYKPVVQAEPSYEEPVQEDNFDDDMEETIPVPPQQPSYSQTFTPVQTVAVPPQKPAYVASQPAQVQSAPAAQTQPVGKRQAPDYSHYEFPPYSLLKHMPPIVDGNNEGEIQKICQDMINAFANFKIQISVNDIVVGPRIIRYSISLPAGTRINAVTNLTNDIALALSSKSVRIEQIPDTPYLGVEIPNRHPKTVLLSSLIETPEFKNNKITRVPLGASVTGSPVFADIAKMPHVLVAGATGMGKSVLINAILVSLLYKARPDEVKLILVDPKQVEFAVYAGIPHLLIPPVIEPQKAAGALIWARGEMERRYALMTKYGVRSIDSYNEIVKKDPTLGEFQPKIIVVIDELNDLMLQARDAVEPSIMSIAQKARAAGIHLIIGTQRPSVDVITGVIKANIPSRIALHVTSMTDSRTILDVVGAEKLLNNGDSLAMISGLEPVRVQSAFVSDEEVEAVTQFLKDHAGPAVYDDLISAQIDSETEKYKNEKNRGRGSSSDDSEGMDESEASIFEDSKFMLACDVAFEAGKISTSFLQRRIGVGYGKAAKYIDYMEHMGMVSQADGAKPREILITKDQFMEMVARNSHFEEG